MSVEVRTVTGLSELAAVDRLFGAIWRQDPGSPVLSTELLRALVKSGNYVAAAYDGAALLGACVGFFGVPGARELHSHIAGVAPEAVGRSVGYALKQHQRSWALERGATAISWTFDPLVARNAYFNLAKLGAAPVEYLPNFYGAMHDRINGDDESDRLLVRWDLSRPATPLRDDTSGAVVALGRDGVPGNLDGGKLLVAVPPDVETLRRRDPGEARRWRPAVRDALSTLLAAGARVTGFDRAGWYVLRRPS
ncbi:GNAT family N-acetyltransferase [Actinoplanes sp. NPDC049681]|uniref:GNAT family N-acetyltransferase n=1 Tax=Actinoplanes sp. NPDC049681 TaxID=3363905 RepID=UPI0037B11283